jgi:uncharacterized membrane protein
MPPGCRALPMLVLVYYMGAELFLIDPAVMELTVWQAVAISLASLAFGWMAYDTICKVFVNANQTVLMGCAVRRAGGDGVVLHAGLFGPRGDAASGGVHRHDHVGNVFFIIMPNQRVVVADLKAGRKPDPKYGKIAKQRSTTTTI